ncbi:MAG: alcohol dehydrogenase catalytic domain-containing protein [Acidobacteria bacterium]|nr:alcohol dehydrogenase catalytic domain-containing protein [Acidobacteriota bacterium]MBI3656356.1 alcohol dehydrogenase catalytic domain-containing protein [Acidobacteriota bacterium]
MKGLVLDGVWDPRPGVALSESEKQTRKVMNGNTAWRYPALRVENVNDPKICPDEVLVKVCAVGICGSDLSMVETDKDGYMLYPGLTRLPSVLGHECSGEVIEVGRNVTGLMVHERVAVEDMIKCGHCAPCRMGWPNQCRNLDEIGFSTHGAIAEYLAIKAENCWSIHALVERYGGDFEKACEAGATVELTAVVYNGLFEIAGGFRPGAFAAVYGAGPIGLSALALLKSAGAACVMVFEPSRQRQTLARALGADFVFDPTEVIPHEAVLDVTKGIGADVHVEAAGAPTQTFPEIEQCLAIGARVIMIGKSAKRTSVFLETFQDKRAQIFAANGNSGYGTYLNVIRLMAAGAFDPTVMVTRRYTLDTAIAAIENLKAREEGKILIKP